MKRIISTKTNAIFLATILLLAGTIALSFPLFLTNVQAQQENNGMDNRYNIYEPTTEYPPQYAEKEYNSYEPSYEMDTYETPPSYGNKNNYEPKYTSYQPDYKPEYTSYGKESNSYKPNDRDSNVSINKINCNINNININGDNTGNVNVGNNGRSASSQGTDEGYLGVDSSGGNYGERYDNGYNKHKDQGFTCINNNNNIVTENGDNVPLTCDECFRTIFTAAEIAKFEQINLPIDEYCEAILAFTQPVRESDLRADILAGFGVVEENRIIDLIECLTEVGIVFR